jgi:hypothetical protein
VQAAREVTTVRLLQNPARTQLRLEYTEAGVAKYSPLLVPSELSGAMMECAESAGCEWGCVSV